MPGILIDNRGYLKDILSLLGVSKWNCNWLITGLDCHDYCSWPGCEKWAEETLFLSNEEFLHDVKLRNMQFVWGVFTAVPTRYSREERRIREMLESVFPNIPDPRLANTFTSKVYWILQDQNVELVSDQILRETIQQIFRKYGNPAREKS